MSEDAAINTVLGSVFSESGSRIYTFLAAFLCYARHGRRDAMDQEERNAIIDRMFSDCRAASDKAVDDELWNWAKNGRELHDRMDCRIAIGDLYVASARGVCEWFLAETAR